MANITERIGGSYCSLTAAKTEWMFREQPMRYIDYVGEVAEYMFILSLNKLGEAFLKIDKFVSQPHPYSRTRPKGISIL